MGSPLVVIAVSVTIAVAAIVILTAFIFGKTYRDTKAEFVGLEVRQGRTHPARQLIIAILGGGSVLANFFIAVGSVALVCSTAFLESQDPRWLYAMLFAFDGLLLIMATFGIYRSRHVRRIVGGL